MSYHTAEAFEKRMVERRANPQKLPEPAVFYHVAAMGNWKKVVTEQCRLLAFVGFREATACVLGTMDDALWCQDKAHDLGIALAIAVVNRHLHEHEHPTLAEVYLWSLENQKGAALYLHTKGVSKPDCRITKHWRRVMQKFVVSEWRDNLKRLEQADMVGVAWQHVQDFPHFQGNFWMARADWLSRLPDPRYYRTSRPADFAGIAGQAWWRMNNEAWLGAAPWHHIDERCSGSWLWTENVLPLAADIPGFSYED